MLVNELESHELNMQYNSMRKQSSPSKCTARCDASVLDKMDVQQVLMISTNTMLVAPELLSIFTDVQNKNFQQQRFNRMLSRCRLAWAARRSSASDSSRTARSGTTRVAKAATTAHLYAASGRTAGRRMRGGLLVVLLSARALPRLVCLRKVPPLPLRRLRLLLRR